MGILFNQISLQSNSQSLFSLKIFFPFFTLLYRFYKLKRAVFNDKIVISINFIDFIKCSIKTKLSDVGL